MIDIIDEEEVKESDQDLVGESFIDQIEENEIQNLEKYKEESIRQGMANDFEVLSNLDPDDEFLQSEQSISLIDSILLSKRESSFSVISSRSSEFSVVSTSKIH